MPYNIDFVEEYNKQHGTNIFSYSENGGKHTLTYNGDIKPLTEYITINPGDNIDLAFPVEDSNNPGQYKIDVLNLAKEYADSAIYDLDPEVLFFLLKERIESRNNNKNETMQYLSYVIAAARSGNYNPLDSYIDLYLFLQKEQSFLRGKLVNFYEDVSSLLEELFKQNGQSDEVTNYIFNKIKNSNGRGQSQGQARVLTAAGNKPKFAPAPIDYNQSEFIQNSNNGIGAFINIFIIIFIVIAAIAASIALLLA